MVTAARSRKVRFVFIIQNYAQLTQVYGKENGETIKGNCNTVYLISNELQALEEISKMCGEVKSKKDDKTASTPLVTVSDLQRLSQFEIIVLRLRMMPYRTKFTPNFKLDWGHKYEKATHIAREKRSIELFDIREFVKNKKQEKMSEMMGSMDVNPFANMVPGGIGGMMPNMNSMANSNNTGFNVDELVKKIDAKIAELEEEERREEEANRLAKTSVIDTGENVDINKVEQPDDDFFDDFFSDE